MLCILYINIADKKRITNIYYKLLLVLHYNYKAQNINQPYYQFSNRFS